MSDIEFQSQDYYDEGLDNAYDNQYNYMQEQYLDYELDMNLAKKSSVSQYYTFCSTQKIDARINTEIESIMNMTCLPYQWAFQLYSECLWQMPPIYKLMDVNSSFKKVILFKENYEPLYGEQTSCCEVCYEEQKLISNACGHAYCLNCWAQLLKANVYSSSDIFPKCQGEQCNQKMNYKLSRMILEEPNNNQLKNKFNKVKIVQYSRYNDSVKICPDPKCDNKFLINDLSHLPIICKCGMYVCAYCGKPYHYPIYCAERQNWEKINQDQSRKWLEIVNHKICPSCKDPIEKNGGCNHMTCKCKHQFCWICLQDWRTHGVCAGISAHEQMEKQREKMLKNEKKYREAFEEAQVNFQRYSHYQERVNSYDCDRIKAGLVDVGVPFQNVHIIENLKQYLLAALQFSKSCITYNFFRGENGDKILKVHLNKVETQLEEIDEYLLSIKDSYEAYRKEDNQEKKDQLKSFIKDNLLEERRQAMSEKLSVSNEFLIKIFERK